jgi:hypothetical protein
VADSFAMGTVSAPPAYAPQGGVWRHYKGGLYRVLGMVRNSTNGADRPWMVLYVSMTYGEVYVRELDEFVGQVEVDGVTVQRFRPMGSARQAPEAP